MDNVKIEVPALLATASDQQLLDELNCRGRQVKWSRPQTARAKSDKALSAETLLVATYAAYGVEPPCLVIHTDSQPPKIKDWVKLGLSPSTDVEEIDCTEQDND